MFFFCLFASIITKSKVSWKAVKPLKNVLCPCQSGQITYFLVSAYILAEEGYDVWMGNARGNFYSRRHVSFNPDAILNTDFWRFSWDEIGNIDLPTMIDYVLAYTGRSRLHYIGHSQGTTSFFVMTSLQPAYNEKIISMHALAPVAYMAHNRNPLLLVLSPFSTSLEVSLGT